MRKAEKSKGYSLIEILVVLVIIAALTAIAIPMYIGVRDRSREASIVASARGSLGELEFWLHSAISLKDEREVDTNFSGVIDAADKTDEELFDEGVATVYTENRNVLLKEKSPWDYNIPLWTTDNTMPPGRVTVIQQTDNEVRVIAKSRNGRLLFDQFVSAD